MKSAYVCNTQSGDPLLLPVMNFDSPSTNASARLRSNNAQGAGENTRQAGYQAPADPAFGAGPDEEPLPLPSLLDRKLQ